MEIKPTPQGILIYSALAAYVLAFAGMLLRVVRLGRILFFAGFAIMVAAFSYRWYHVQHVPMQNLFEVFLTLGMIIYPLSWFCRRFLGVGGEVDQLLRSGGILSSPQQFTLRVQVMDRAG